MLKRNTLKGTTIALALSGLISFGSTPGYAVLGDQVLKTGMDHKDVQVLQEELKNFGLFSEESTTTYYGVITEQSVRAFQISQGLEINGTFDLSTFEALNALKNKTTTSQDVNEVVELSPEIKKTPSSALIYDRELSLKITGEDVRILQEALKAMNYLDIDVCTDYYGTQTEEALKSFQTSQGLRADGIAGLRTIEAINEVLVGRNIALPKPSRGSDIGNIAADIIATGKKYIGVPYVFGGTSPKGFDCSGFTSYVYKQHGISIPRDTSGQAGTGVKLSKSDLKPGDLLIFSNTYKAGPSHAGIYIGNGQFVHASSTRSGGVIISDLNSSYYTNHFSYGRRVF